MTYNDELISVETGVALALVFLGVWFGLAVTLRRTTPSSTIAIRLLATALGCLVYYIFLAILAIDAGRGRIERWTLGYFIMAFSPAWWSALWSHYWRKWSVFEGIRLTIMICFWVPLPIPFLFIQPEWIAMFGLLAPVNVAAYLLLFVLYYLYEQTKRRNK